MIQETNEILLNFSSFTSENKMTCIIDGGEPVIETEIPTTIVTTTPLTTIIETTEIISTDVQTQIELPYPKNYAF